MFSAGHNAVVVSEQLIGPETAINSVVLTFNQHLDPATADNADAYAIVRRITSTNSDSGGISSGLDPFGSSGGTTYTVSTKHVHIAAAVYDDATMTVTLTPSVAFRADKYFRFVRVVGTGKNAILSADGAALDGQGIGRPSDSVIKFASKRSHQLIYRDGEHNKVTITLKGPGELRAMFRRTGSPDPLIFVVGGVAGRTILNGTVKAGHHGTGVTTIDELSGAGSFQNNLSGNAAFNILATV